MDLLCRYGLQAPVVCRTECWHWHYPFLCDPLGFNPLIRHVLQCVYLLGYSCSLVCGSLCTTRKWAVTWLESILNNFQYFRGTINPDEPLHYWIGGVSTIFMQLIIPGRRHLFRLYNLGTWIRVIEKLKRTEERLTTTKINKLSAFTWQISDKDSYGEQ